MFNKYCWFNQSSKAQVENYGPQAKFNLQPVFVSGFIGARLLPTHQPIVYDCFQTAVELGSWERDQMTSKTYNIYYLALYRQSLYNPILKERKEKIIYINSSKRIYWVLLILTLLENFQKWDIQVSNTTNRDYFVSLAF